MPSSSPILIMPDMPIRAFSIMMRAILLLYGVALIPVIRRLLDRNILGHYRLKIARLLNPLCFLPRWVADGALIIRLAVNSVAKLSASQSQERFTILNMKAVLLRTQTRQIEKG